MVKKCLSCGNGLRNQKLPVRRSLCNRCYQREYQKKIWPQKKLAAVQKLGGKCKRCGFDDIRALQFDHIKGNGYRDKGIRAVNRVLNGSDLYQLLCANCNWIKRFENGEQAGYLQHNKRPGSLRASHSAVRSDSS